MWIRIKRILDEYCILFDICICFHTHRQKCTCIGLKCENTTTQVFVHIFHEMCKHFIFAPRTFLNFNQRRRPPVCFIFFSSFPQNIFQNSLSVWENGVTPNISTTNIELDHLLFYQTSISYKKSLSKDELKLIPTFSRCRGRGTRRTRKTTGWRWRRRKRRRGWGEAMMNVYRDKDKNKDSDVYQHEDKDEDNYVYQHKNANRTQTAKQKGETIASTH